MKKLLSFLVVMVITVTLFAQTTYYVNDNSTSGDVFTSAIGNNSNAGTAAAPFATLQYAVNAVAEGDIINVDAGTYIGQVTINKGLTIIGAGQNLTFITNAAQLIAPAGSFAEYALIQTTQGIGDVHIRDLTATNGTNGDGHTIMIQSGGSVKNCTLLNGGQGIFFRIESAIKTALMENNTIQPTGIGINCEGSGLTALIRNNTITKSTEFYSGIFAGLDFGPLPSLTVTNNIINNYASYGIGILAASFNGTINYNSLTGAGIAINRNGNGGNTLSATCNWFGSSNAGTVVSKISGTINYTPFLTDGTDASSNVGFQPAGACGTGNTYYVNDNNLSGNIFTTAVGNNANAGTASAPFATIQYAVDIAAANDVIYVDAGTYTEQVTTTKGITIIGAGQNLTSILKPAITVAPPGSFTEQGVIQTAQNIGDVNIKDLSVTGDYNVGVTPIIIQSSGSVRNCKLQSGNQGLFIRIDAATNPGSKIFLIEGNIIEAEYIAVNVEGTALNATLNNNTLRAFNGFSVGVFAGMDFGPIGRITATNNLFNSYLTSGIWVNASNASITQNAFTGTGSSAINRTGGANVTANCNWYGAANASSIVPKVNAGVNYFPWYVDGTDQSPVAGFQHTSESCGSGGNVLYVNDNSTSGDIFTTTTGNDANAGTSPTSPLATIDAALTKASAGTSIYVDAGTYSQSLVIGKQVQIIGTNYSISPNSSADPLVLNPSRNAESIIENSSWTIGADGISLTGLTFNPLSNNAVVLNGNSFGNINMNRNRVRLSNLFPAFIFNGAGTSAITFSGITNWGLTVSENRFEKEDASSGTSMRVNRFGNVNIYNNSFVVTGATARTQTCMNTGSAGLVPYLFINNNTFDKASTAINSGNLAYTYITNNKFINTNTALIGNNLSTESSDVFFQNNTLDGSGGIVPFVQYTRQAGDAVGASSSFTAENNTVSGTAVAGTTTLLGSMNLIFANSVLNQSLTVRNNKISYNGDLSTVEGQFIRPIMIRGNLKNSVVEKNEITLSGTNLQPRNPANILPVCPAITLYTENGSAAFLQPGSVINILNNKVNGFKHSFVAFDAGTGTGANDAYTGFGNIPAGVTVNVNNNSFTGDSISINNGTVGQPVLATCNWYGSADAAVVIPKISGIATYGSWLTNGTDNNIATGFQPVSNTCNGRQNKFYVNDGSQTDDVFTTAVGNDANSGVPSSPLLTINAALTKASAGDTIYVDAGTYANADITIGKSITLLGTNYLTNPNDGTNPLNAAGRTAEANISNTIWTIGFSDIRIKGFTFDPQSKTALAQSNNTLDFDNIEVSNNIFLVKSVAIPVSLIGKQQLPLVTFNYSITNNRFVKSVGGNGSNISMAGIDGILISGNTFTTTGGVADWTQNAYTGFGGFRNNNFVISNNTAYRPRFAFQGLNAVKAQVSLNKITEAVRFQLDFNGINVPTEINITDNNVTIANSNGAPALSYSKSNGTDLSSPNIARIERNNFTVDGTGWSLVPQALIAPTIDNLSANTQVFIRDNKLNITGNFSTQSDPGNYVSAIRFLNNSRQVVVERNEMQFSATNYGTSNKFGIGILYAGLQPGTSFDFLNNKFSGFSTSIGVQNNGNNNNYGELPAGVILNINNNSFTGDVTSINNGTTGQSATASCNWYGSAAAQNFISKLTLPTVDPVPWLTNGTDNDVATGFQQVPGSCDGYPTLITLDSYTNVTCNGAANGTINITTTNGKAPFIYTWTKDGDANFISHDEDPTGLAPGVYHLAMVDGNGSNIYITAVDANGPGTIVVTITEPPVLTASATGTNNNCFGQTTGTATVSVSGGTSSYTYLWSNGATTQSISNLSAAIYSVIVTDANGCTATTSYEVTEPPALSASATGSNVNCNGGSDGSASVSVSGGTSSYTYLWSNGATTQSISNLSAAIYSVTVTDANGCTATSSYEVTQPPVLSASATGTNVSCNSGSDGSASVSVSGGTSSYTYLWSNGATTQSISNLAAATYNVTVTDAKGCTATSSYEVTQPPVLTASATGTNVSCNGGSDGSASVSVSGGTSSYSYLWSNGATTQSISNLSAAIYSVTVTDANGCTATSSYEVTQPPVLTASATGTNVNCNGGNNGSATVSINGGTSSYTYLWSNGATTQSIINLAAATYNVTVTDAKGCTVTTSYTVTQPTLLKVTMTGTTAACNGSSTATPSGGVAPYTYLWSNGRTTQTISNVPAGTYTVTVKDANNCTVSGSFTITGNSSINPTTSLVSVSCFGGNNGSITVTGSGGTAPFTYNLNGSAFQSSNVFSNLTAGVYIVGVKDATGCSDFVTRTITQPALLTAVLDSTRKTCFGANSGRIFVSITGGTGAKTYSWTGPNGYTSTAQSPNNLFAGNYSLLVTDTRGCTATLNATVASFGEIVITSSITNVLCRGSLTGAINITVSGGTGSGFNYSWTGAVTSTSEDLLNIGASNNYNVRITDIGSGCFINRTFAVTQPAANLSVSVTSTNVTGCTRPGVITATGAGGTAPYSYNINGGAYQLSGTFNGLYAGNYTIGVRDANGCTASTSRTITDNGSDAYESNNSRNQSKPISIGTTINARIAVGTDIADWFTFTTPAGGGSVTYSLIVTHPSVNYTFDLYPGTGNGGPIAPSAVISSTRKDYLLAPGTAYRISVTSATLSYTCYNLSISTAIPVALRITLPPAIQKETNKLTVTDVLRSAVYPNPHHGSFALRIESSVSGEAIVEIISVTGQRIEQRKLMVTKGAYNIVRFTNMRQPALLYRVTVGKEVINGKIIGAN